MRTMKARVATVLSLTGVLVAGSAAALVNTQVLRNAERSDSNSVLVADPSSSSGADSSVGPTESPTTTVQVAVSTTHLAELTAYQVGSSGLVTLDQAGDVLRIESATPSTGWKVTGIQQVDSLNVKVLFQQNDTVVEFRANLLFDTVTPSVSTYPASQSPSTSNSVDTTTGSSGTTGNTSTTGTTRTTVDDNHSNAPTTSDDSGKGRGGRGGDDSSHPSDDD
jgi:hypothetical protein